MQKNMTAGWILTALLLLAPLAGAKATTLYKWVDESGQVHYSQTPPEKGRNADRMTLSRSATASPAEKQEAREEEDEASDQLTQMRQIRQQNCESARQNLQVYQQNDSVKQPDGQVIHLDAATRRAKIAEAEGMVKEFCRD